MCPLMSWRVTLENLQFLGFQLAAVFWVYEALWGFFFLLKYSNQLKSVLLLEWNLLVVNGVWLIPYPRGSDGQGYLESSTVSNCLKTKHIFRNIADVIQTCVYNMNLQYCHINQEHRGYHWQERKLNEMVAYTEQYLWLLVSLENMFYSNACDKNLEEAELCDGVDCGSMWCLFNKLSELIVLLTSMLAVVR